MTNKSVWVRIPVDIYNRDRAGGHGPAILTDDFGYKGECGVRAARGLKKDRRRKHRREARRIKEEAITLMMADGAEADREARDLEQSEFDAWVYEDFDSDYEARHMLEMEREARIDRLYQEIIEDESYLEWDY